MVSKLANGKFGCLRCGATIEVRSLVRDHLLTHDRRLTVAGRCCAPGGPPHDASANCESGWYFHCSCDTCF